MQVAKALRIVMETASPHCDTAALARIHALAGAASPLLSLPVEDCAGGPGVLAALPREAHDASGELAAALRLACRAALQRIPPIDHRPTRSEAKQALRAVSAIERLADALQSRLAA